MTDAEINRCRKSKKPSNCQTCPAYARCLQLAREAAARQFGTEPPEEVEE